MGQEHYKNIVVGSGEGGKYKASGADLMMGEATFSAAKTLDVRLNEGGTRSVIGERIFSTLAHTLPFLPCVDCANVALLQISRRLSWMFCLATWL
jgi:hypothetical protein